MNVVVTKDELMHYGKLGMKWGVRSAARRTNALEKKVSKTVRKFDRGKDLPDGYVNDLSRKVRTQKYKLDRKN